MYITINAITSRSGDGQTPPRLAQEKMSKEAVKILENQFTYTQSKIDKVTDFCEENEISKEDRSAIVDAIFKHYKPLSNYNAVLQQEIDNGLNTEVIQLIQHKLYVLEETKLNEIDYTEYTQFL